MLVWRVHRRGHPRFVLTFFFVADIVIVSHGVLTLSQPHQRLDVDDDNNRPTLVCIAFLRFPLSN